MARQKSFLDTDVLTEARKRLHVIYDLHDTVTVCFSGGKDSLAVLHLVREVARERGLPDKIKVIFRDEELIPQSVIDFVDKYRQMDWIEMLYFAVPLKSTKFILGRAIEYVQWEPGRRHIRPVPPHAITLEPGDDRVFDQYNMDSYAASFYRGRVALVTGVRASESLIRFRASVNKLNLNYINAVPDPSVRNAKLCKPLYDWQEDDVFKYFYDNQIEYCSLYDAQHLAGTNMRVSTPLHAEASKKYLGQLRMIDPVFYNQLIDLFPEMLVQVRYWDELDRAGLLAKFGQSFEGIQAFIDEAYGSESEQHQKATLRLAGIVRRERVQPGCYPTDYVFKYFQTGAFKRELNPQGPKR